MKNFSIEISPAAERDFKKLKSKLQNFNELINIIDNLSIEPRPFGVRKIKSFQNIYRIRYSYYRIIYSIFNKENRVVILRVLKRNESTYKFI